MIFFNKYYIFETIEIQGKRDKNGGYNVL